MQIKKYLLISVTNFIILCGSLLLSIWARLSIPLGKTLGSSYNAYPLELLYVLFGALGIATISIYICRRLFLPYLSVLKEQLGILFLSLLFMTACLGVYLPDFSQLQLAYFVLSMFGLSLTIIILPVKLHRQAYLEISIVDNLVELYQKRGLLFLWLKYRIEARYVQTLLGILWIILLPLSTSLVLTFALGTLLGAGQVAEGVSTVSFILSGLAIFGIFSDLILKAKSSIGGASSIISRVYFPREILIILVLGEALIDFFFVFLAVILINISQGIYPSWHYLILPIPLLILVFLSMGLAFGLAWLGLIIQDLQQLLTVVIQLLFYIVVLYSPGQLDARYDFIINMLPLTAIVVAFRDIMLFNQMPDWISLIYPLVLGFVMLYLGYVYFKVNEDQFMDFI